VQSDDPTVIRSLAVHADDVIAALEANARREAGAVLRVTPPFNGRMRARLHLAGTEGEYEGDVRPIHVPPLALVTDSAPAFPDPDETEDRLRADATVEYTAERHRERHVERVEEWREAVREHLVEATSIETSAGPHEVRIATLG
jgi:hypothetical protein